MTILLATACSAPGPVPVVLPQVPPAYPQAEDGAAAAQRWWEALHDPVLDQLIDAAQRNNHDVRLALARVAQARAVLPAVDSRSAPNLALGGALSDQRSGLPPQVKFGLPDTRAAQLDVNLAWELDLMGAAAAGSAAARADLVQGEWAVRGAQMMVANEVARQYLQLQAIDRGAALAAAIVTTFDLTAHLLAAREREGSASRLDMERLMSARATAQARLPDYTADRSAVLDRINLLLGQAPGAALPLPVAAAVPLFDPYDPQALLQPGIGLLADPGKPPVGQPADLLLRRPDLQAAASAVTAGQARRRQAHAERYPRLFLSALFGGERLTLNAIPYSPARYSNAALAFSAPLFNGGRLEALEDLQAARVDEASLAFEQSALRAVQEVDASLAQLKGQRERCLALLEARDRALAALDRIRILQHEGEADALGVLDLVRTTFLAQAAVLDAERDRGLAAIRLYAALGGGWPDTTPEASR